MTTIDSQDLLGRLSRTDPANLHNVWLLVTVAVAIAVVSAGVPVIWRVVRISVTICHELGHAIIGLLGGRHYRGLELHSDMSGVTYTSGSGRLALAACMWAGYPSPAVTGVLLSCAAMAGFSPAALAALAIIPLLFLLKARSLYTVAVILIFSCTMATVWWFGTPTVQLGSVLTLSWFFTIGAWKSLHDAWVQRKIDGGEADADKLAELLWFPEPVWLAGFAATILACTVGVTWLGVLLSTGATA